MIPILGAFAAGSLAGALWIYGAAKTEKEMLEIQRDVARQSRDDYFAKYQEEQRQKQAIARGFAALVSTHKGRLTFTRINLPVPADTKAAQN